MCSYYPKADLLDLLFISARTNLSSVPNKLLHLLACNYINSCPAHELRVCQTALLHLYPPAKVTLCSLRENLFPPSAVAVPTSEVSARDHLNQLDGISKHVLEDWILLFWSNLCFQTKRIWITNFLGTISSFPLCQRPGP